MILSRYINPHFIKIEDDLIKIINKMGLPISETLKIKSLGGVKLASLAYCLEGIVRDDKGKITMVYIYEKDVDTETSRYLFRLKLLGNLSIKQI